VSSVQLGEILASVVTAGAVGLLALGMITVVAPARLGMLRSQLQHSGMTLVAIVAGAATVASLVLSQVYHFPPCTLCWYQRIAIYPLAVLSAVAAVRGDQRFRPYAAVLAAAGLAVNLWHNVVETFPSADTGGCDAANPCTIRWIEAFGFWTIPRMVTVCLFSILAILWLDRPFGDS
jgi:disulfide bond formation protein DsbB